MNDDALTPLSDLASAALDNEVTAAERAQVQASPTLQAEMQVYAGIRGDLAAISIPVDVRESAIGAALAAFDAMQSGSSTAATSKVVSIDSRRRRQYRWIGGAAAAAVVAVLGVAAITAYQPSDDKKASATTLVSLAQSDQTFKSPASLPAGVANSEVSAEGGAEVNDAPAATGAAETTAAGALDSSAPSPETAFADPWAGAQSFEDPQALALYAANGGFGPLLDDSVLTATPPPSTPPSTTAAPTAETTAASDGGVTADSTAAITVADPFVCVAGLSLTFAPAYYRGQPVIVVVDEAAHVVSVIDRDTCAVVATAALP